MKSLTALVLLTLPVLSIGDDDDLGWQVGLGVVSSDVYDDAAERPFFPHVRDDTKQWMLIPNLKWQGTRWSIGADGVGWRSELSQGLKLTALAGFPASRINLSGQRGWFRYGTGFSASYGNGTTLTASANAAGLSYEHTIGLAERSDDLKQKIGFGAPLYISEAGNMVVIGSATLTRENASFIENDKTLSQTLSQDSFLHPGLSLFTVIPLRDNFSLLLSGSVQWNDDKLLADVERASAVQANTFILLNVQF